MSIQFDWNAVDATYFSNTQSIALTVFGIMAGTIAGLTCRYKWQMVIGACIRLLGLGLMLRYRDAGSSTAQIIIPQVLQGLGGGMLGVLLQLAAQVNVPHQDVAMVTAFVLLLTEIGGAVGSAITGAVLLRTLPARLAEYLPDLSAADRASIVSGLYVNPPLGTPIRNGINRAWSDLMHNLLLIAIVAAVIPIILTLFLTDRPLPKHEQNAVGDKRKFSEISSTDSSNNDLDTKDAPHSSSEHGATTKA